MLRVCSLLEEKEHWDRVVDIFFESTTKKDFKSAEEKNAFLNKYLGFYFNKYPEYFLVATNKDKVLGYICGSPNSINETQLYELLPHYSLFEDLYKKFPAHLHINLSADSRGLGIGSLLIQQFEKLCSGFGIHLITSPDARNRNFYLKNNYEFEYVRKFNGLELLLMGKTL